MGIRLEFVCDFCEDIEHVRVTNTGSELNVLIKNSNVDLNRRGRHMPSGWLISYHPAPANTSYVVMCGPCIRRTKKLQEEADRIKAEFLEKELRKPRLESDRRMREKERERIRDGL